MKWIAIGPRIFVAVVVLLTAAFAYAEAQGSVPRGITVAERHAAEAEIARSGIVVRLEAAMGESFGGVWFERSTGRLHVGAPTDVSRRGAEAAAARAGVAEIVVETPVDSTWEELEAGQKRWSHILADLFDRAEVSTSLLPQDNAVEVVLGSLVRAPRRAKLEASAASDSVGVVIKTSLSKHFRLERDARCNAFATGEAYCNPTIVAGVTIQHEENKAEPCTAGPVVLPTDRSTGAKATERFLLTAGHCIDIEGKEKWFAFNKAGTKLEIGKAGAYINGHEGDIGVIPIKNDPKLWTHAGFIPVTPTIAPWGQAEPEPFPVVGSQPPVIENETCMSGQTTGTSCGPILKVMQTIAGAEGMTEVEATRAGGDSGAPWYNQSYAGIGEGMVEGIHVGKNGATGNAAFQPLEAGLELLKEKKGVDVELLTQNNEEQKHS
jgi:hypothetical protein